MEGESDGNRMRDTLARRTLLEIPRLLTLQDRTPVSPGFGSFDRAWWQYRIIDFPSGMAQSLVLPLALVWSLDMPGNIYRNQPEVRRWVEAGIRFAARAAHRDGSSDDYYPFERAAGATAFALLACLDAAEIIGLGGDPEVDSFFQTRARWLAGHRESCRLANHEALIAVCLQRMVERFGDSWERPLRGRLARLLEWQHPEGWFAEYGGADPGYQTLTIAQLADLDRRRPDLELRAPIERAIGFVHALLHPDGTLGGEYCSRATVNYFPHGFEIAGEWNKLALAVNDLALLPLARDAAPAISDDRLFVHHLTSRLLAWREWRDERAGAVQLPTGRTIFQAARLLVDGRGHQRLYLGWSRGGAFRLFEEDRLLLADTGPTLAMRDGRVAVTHLEGDNRVSISDDEIRIAGRMAWARSTRLTPLRSILLRLTMMTLGRALPNLVRHSLQRLLVTGRSPAPFRFVRVLTRVEGCWKVRDELYADKGWEAVKQGGIGGFQSSMTTAMAQCWEPAQLQSWVPFVPEGDPLVIERRPGSERQ